MAERKQLSKKVRFEVFKRDSFRCQYCGATPPNAILHVDHIVPVAEGGKNNIDNLLTACSDCNLGKGARSLLDIPKTLKDKAAELKEREDQIEGYNALMKEKVKRIEQEAWEVAAKLDGSDSVESYNRMNLLSIKNFLDKLPYWNVIRAAEIAFARRPYNENQRFKYFCGVCWGMIREASDA